MTPTPPRPAAPHHRRLRLAAETLALGVVLALAVSPAAAQDRADIDRTQIIGNRELPKVLYIVPWKKPIQGDLAGRPTVSLLDEVLGPVDRDVFRRQVSYDAQIQPRAAATAPSAPRTR
jgi:hypothetical protein